MNILVTINSQYVKQLNILLNSIQKSNKDEKFNVYVLNRNLTGEQLKEIQKGLDLDNFYITDIKVNEKEITELPVYDQRYPVEIYFRIFVAKYLPNDVDRVLYLDSDTLVINKLDELYNMDFDGNYFIAATHIKKVLHKFNEIRLGMEKDKPYINTGVLLINLKELRKIEIEKEVADFIQKNEKKLILPDQDIISAIYGDKIKLVSDLKYNLGDRNLNYYNLNNPKSKIGIKWIRKNTVVIHYFGRNKPWNNGYIGKLGCFYYKFIDELDMDNNKKVLILSCGTGGGHNTAAKAIQEELIEKGINADFKEYLEIINPKLKDGINNLYIKSTNKNGKVFKKAYYLGTVYEKTKLKSPVYFLNSLNKDKLYRYIKDNHYNFIVTTHLFAAQALTAIKKEHHIHFLQVATDYVSIPFWEETNPDYFVIPSKELEADFLEKGIKKQKLLSLGIPVRKQFREKYDKEETKKQLKLDINKKYILILNGSMGFGNVKEITKELLENIKDYTFIISCGNNTELADYLSNEYKDNERIIALPYTSELGKYMASCEIILSKPGGLTSTEIATMRKPLVHIMPIPGCENYNADFFEKRHMSVKCENLEQVVEGTKKLLEDESLQNQIIENQKKYIKGNTCEEIVEVVVKQLDRGNVQWKKLSSEKI